MTCPGSGDRSVAKLETENRSGFRTNLGTESLSLTMVIYFFFAGHSRDPCSGTRN